MDSVKQISGRFYNLFTEKKLELIDSLKKQDLQNQTKEVSLTIEEDMAGSGAVARTSDKMLQDLKQKDREKRNKLVIWKQPLRTLKFFFLEVKYKLWQLFNKLLTSKSIVGLLTIGSLVYILSISMRGRHTEFIARWKKQIHDSGGWLVLGILSSCGFGTGLHTFLLYLGPFVGKVTLAANECNSVNFLTPPYPDEILCPGKADAIPMTMWRIARKVRWECFMWGMGTAIGELPPYFLARSAMLTGVDPDDDDYEEATQRIETMTNSDDGSLYTRVMKLMKVLVEKAGFLGILLAASIPNPLFDLAGITCGHFLVPFWTFFGATLIGKAVIKMHIQMLFVIFIFSAEYVDMLINWIGYVPLIGTSLQKPFASYLQMQKDKLHHKPEGSMHIKDETNIIKFVFDLVVSFMFIFFALSIVNSFAQANMARAQKCVRDKKMDNRRQQ